MFVDSVSGFISQPLVWKVLGGYWVYNAAVTALRPPNPASKHPAISAGYGFVYRFAHTLAGNLDRAAQKLGAPGA